MEQLIKDIENATTSEQLLSIVESIERQENGHKTSLARQLDDCFWYVDLNSFELQKGWLLRILKFN